jgi:signal transduction histidine kinase
MRDASGKPYRVVGTDTDITERRRAEETVKESEKKLRLLSSHLLTAQETERQRISRELHDELGQELIALKLRLRSITTKLRKDQAKLRDECDQTQGYIDQILENVRRLSRDLSPYVLEDLGFSAALQRMITDFGKHHNIEGSIDMPNIDNPFPQKTQLTIYRVFQEALTNIAKHAQATRVSVTIRERGDCVSFLVEDDGRGFDRKQTMIRDSAEKGIGLSTMDERISTLRGSLSVESCKERGTKIHFTIPKSQERV